MILRGFLRIIRRESFELQFMSLSFNFKDIVFGVMLHHSGVIVKLLRWFKHT